MSPRTLPVGIAMLTARVANAIGSTLRLRGRMKRLLLGSLAIVALWSEPAAAGWLQGYVEEINLINDGANDGIYVGLSATTGCTYNSFVVLSADPYFSSVYATLLTAKATHQQIKFYNVYCLGSGYARGNQYTLL